MNLQEAHVKALLLMQKHNLISQGWIFGFCRSNRKLGYCDMRNKVVYVSKNVIENNEWEVIEKIVLHELAHAISPPRFNPFTRRWEMHGYDWKKTCIKIGADPARIFDPSQSEINMPLPKYSSTCPCCGAEYSMLRKGKYFGFHVCSRCRTPLVFKENINATNTTAYTFGNG